MELGRVELRWLYAFPLDGSRLFLLVEVLPNHPLDLLERQVQQPSDDAHRDDRLCINNRFLCTVAQEENLSEKVCFFILGAVGNRNRLHI